MALSSACRACKAAGLTSGASANREPTRSTAPQAHLNSRAPLHTVFQLFSPPPPTPPTHRCPAGHFSSWPPSDHCTPCPVGRFSAEEGAQSCELCAAGTDTMMEGSVGCTVRSLCSSSTERPLLPSGLRPYSSNATVSALFLASLLSSTFSLGMRRGLLSQGNSGAQRGAR